jgi:hypothetical protein
MSTERFKIRVAVTFLAGAQRCALLTDYVGFRGVFVRTDSPPPLMNLLRIELALPDDLGTITMHGMVTQIVLPQDKAGVPGVEIAFFAKTGDPSRIWDQFINHVRERYPESIERPVVLSKDAIDQTRRAHPREAPASTVRIEAMHGAESPVVTDISKGGMFVETSEPYSVGSDLRVTLTDSRSDAKFPLDCVVRRRTFGTGGGIGLEFCNMTDARRAGLQQFLDASGRKLPVHASLTEVRVQRAPQQMMATLPGTGSSSRFPSTSPSEDSWATLDEGWKTP